MQPAHPTPEHKRLELVCGGSLGRPVERVFIILRVVSKYFKVLGQSIHNVMIDGKLHLSRGTQPHALLVERPTNTKPINYRKDGRGWQ